MGTSLTVQSHVVADVQIQAAQLRNLLGSYELSFLVSGSVTNSNDGAVHWLIVHGASVAVRSKGGHNHLPSASLTQPTIVRQGQHNTQFQLHVLLHPHQLETLEAMRNGGDLDFELQLSSRGGDSKQGPSDWPEQASLTVHVPESAWLKQLENAKAQRTLLLELAMPFIEPSAMQKYEFEHIQRAQMHLYHGLFGECIAECRKALEELEKELPSMSWEALTSRAGRENMSKYERHRAVVALVHHYTQPSAHSASRGGTSNYSRAEAALVLALTVSCVSFSS